MSDTDNLPDIETTKDRYRTALAEHRDSIIAELKLGRKPLAVAARYGLRAKDVEALDVEVQAEHPPTALVRWVREQWEDNGLSALHISEIAPAAGFKVTHPQVRTIVKKYGFSGQGERRRRATPQAEAKRQRIIEQLDTVGHRPAAIAASVGVTRQYVEQVAAANNREPPTRPKEYVNPVYLNVWIEQRDTVGSNIAFLLDGPVHDRFLKWMERHRFTKKTEAVRSIVRSALLDESDIDTSEDSENNLVMLFDRWLVQFGFKDRTEAMRWLIENAVRGEPA